MEKLNLYIYLFVLFTGCATVPPNLSEIKTEIRNYYSSGQFEKEVTDIADETIARLEKIDLTDNPAAVFDVDETALLNWGYVEKMDFGYSQETWEDWLLKSSSNPIKGVKKIYDWLIERDVNVIFLTGRFAGSYDATFNNLKNAGYPVFDTLITRSPAESKIPTVQFKQSKRKALTESGYNIIICTGDQPEDLKGDFTGLKVKIPNYIYRLNNP